MDGLLCLIIFHIYFHNPIKVQIYDFSCMVYKKGFTVLRGNYWASIASVPVACKNLVLFQFILIWVSGLIPVLPLSKYSGTTFYWKQFWTDPVTFPVLDCLWCTVKNLSVIGAICLIELFILSYSHFPFPSGVSTGSRYRWMVLFETKACSRRYITMW